MTVTFRTKTTAALKAAGRFAAPAGFLDILNTSRTFHKFDPDPSSAWRSALSPRSRRYLDVSRLGPLPAHILQNTTTVIDVGAEIGRWSEAVLHLVHPERLLAIEPTPESFKTLQDKLGAVPAVQLENCAIGASQGTAELRIMSHAVFNSFLPVRDEIRSIYSDVAERQMVTVAVRTLDEVAADLENVSILKIDVQGAESAVLDGGTDTLRKTTVVVLETNFVSHYEGDTCFDKLHARMAGEFGFELYCYVGPHHEGGQVLFADAIYIRPEAIRP